MIVNDDTPGFLTAVKRSFFARKDINLRLAVHESRRVTREIANRLLTPRQRTTVSHASTSTRRTTIRRRNARSGGTTTRSRIPQKPNFQPPLPSRVVFPADQHWARHLYLNDRDAAVRFRPRFTKTRGRSPQHPTTRDARRGKPRRVPTPALQRVPCRDDRAPRRSGVAGAGANSRNAPSTRSRARPRRVRRVGTRAR